jgi:hypothetical protein
MKSWKTRLGVCALAIGSYAAMAGVASAQSQVACTVTGVVPNITLTCGAQTPPPAGAPTCSALSPDQSQLSAAGNVNLTANCSGASVYKWSGSPTPSGAFASQTGGATNSASIASTTTFSVQGCLADGATCSNPVSAQVSVGSAPPPTGGGGFCSQYPNVQQVTMPWGGGYTSAGGAGFAANGTLVIAFTVPAGYNNMNTGNVNWAEFSGAPTTRLVTLSTQPCDFRLSGGFDPTGATAPMTAANSGLGALQWSLSSINNPSSPVAQLFPGQTYYVNIQNKYLRTGAQTCSKGACDIIVLMGLP